MTNRRIFSSRNINLGEPGFFFPPRIVLRFRSLQTTIFHLGQTSDLMLRVTSDMPFPLKVLAYKRNRSLIIFGLHCAPNIWENCITLFREKWRAQKAVYFYRLHNIFIIFLGSSVLRGGATRNSARAREGRNTREKARSRTPAEKEPA